MKLAKPHPQIFLFLGESPKDLGAPFMRLAEFYESPSKLFRGRYFTVDKFKKWYAQHHGRNGRFTYFEDFYGWNVPGDIFHDWATLYAGRETEDEQRLLTALGPLPDRFYIIGAPRKSAATIDHELSHAFWHLFPNYRNAMVSLQKDWGISDIHRYLKANMYASEFYADEVASYLMFDEPMLRRGGVSTKDLWPLRESMRVIFKDHKDAYISL